jgi:hypothetical protein
VFSRSGATRLARHLTPLRAPMDVLLYRDPAFGCRILETRPSVVGDSAADIETARGAGIPVVAVDFGYTEIPVAQLGPDRIIGHFAGLPAAVASLAKAR